MLPILPSSLSFQSTLPVKGATRTLVHKTKYLQISIHAPREGSDPAARLIPALMSLFQSTLPVKGATKYQSRLRTVVIISIHAPREGSDVES